jgi:dTDP-4-dehydrorhamnose reductase
MRPEALDLWGGPECTVNRVGNRFGDQLVESGHDRRDDDLDLIAGIGITAIRYPILWERIAPDRFDQRDWDWTDVRLAKLHTLRIRPIAGLVHHGSGPAYTHLLARDFASGVAAHAQAVAERYPWIEDWTPINEPVTTARFSALYGFWYPHRRDERSFWLALLNQIDATRMAMKAVRRVVPSARLIQTDDLGRTYATAIMRDQAAFDNVRRWMGWDLLCGRVTADHPFWPRLCGFGLEDRLHVIADDPCPPDLIGVNHYLTSDRFLDHRVQHYPDDVRGSNDMRAYADVAAVRVVQPHPPGLAGALREAWARYRIPLAITEVHNGCTRDEQMRWADQAWRTALALRAEDIDLRAVTIWSLFGSQGWDRLLTGGGTYESGVFDTRSGQARPTAMTGLLRQFAGVATGRHPVLAGEGWWTRSIRHHHPIVPRPAPIREHAPGVHRLPASAAPVLIAGASGTLGQTLAAACRHRDLHHVLTDRHELDLTDPHSIRETLDRRRPWVVINAAGWVRVDDAEDDSEACLAANSEGAAALAAACAERAIPSVSFSSDLCFDGCKRQPYVEDDEPNPLNVYGRSKAAMESAIMRLPGSHLIARTAAFFSPFDIHNFAIAAIMRLRDGETFAAAEDHFVSPTYVPHLCDAVLDLAIDGTTGIWHLTNGEALSWAAFGRRIVKTAGLDPARVIGMPGASLGWRAARPAYTALASVRGTLLPSLECALECFGLHFGASGSRDAALPV